MPCHVCHGRKSGETLERLYKAADTAQAQGLSRKSVTQQTKNDKNGRKVLSRVENRLKNDLNEVMANSIFLFAQKKR